jgi:hypothetical protein
MGKEMKRKSKVEADKKGEMGNDPVHWQYIHGYL